MSETNSTSLVLTSVAARLKAAGFRQTGIARAVVELVGEYLGIHANMSPGLAKALSVTNTNALDALNFIGTKSPLHMPQAANDEKREITV